MTRNAANARRPGETPTEHADRIFTRIGSVIVPRAAMKAAAQAVEEIDADELEEHAAKLRRNDTASRKENQ